MTWRDIEGEGMRRIVDSLLEYLEGNPDASDTLDGISRWWVPHDESFSREELFGALEKLVAEGRLDKYISPDGQRLWRRRRAA